MATLCVCGGLQGSGATLVSWCFLQRADMNGVLDGDNDLLPWITHPSDGGTVWYKTTVSCFRLSELVEHFEDYGWEVRPLLVVRDVRRAWASLLAKPCARNGITAEDPPLRLRFRRFLADWELFRQKGWPILRFESFLADPRESLRQACGKLGLDWDEDMLRWPKSLGQIAYAERANQSFRAVRGENLAQTLAGHREQFDPECIAGPDRNWLESAFCEFNAANNYPIHVEVSPVPPQRGIDSVPGFEVTRRREWEMKASPWRRLLRALGIRTPPAASHRSTRKIP
jgi:hypothetical protein